ncbi:MULTISPECIES: helix-turn-helix domain-containing protein [Neptuniibacter]|jgi:transcriptional regulator with XRE-family HTH domain|uniref:helix-turn-helix domain-containing protein n=1 Tax=Neptuniibacter TaxID=459520 RepID=UPI00082BE773|nr:MULTISPECIES: helix-turn-helix transcriptional regulator [Neptuniibacter]MDO6514042.1 helix-turn-helix transcriptional regulator [Neptuniibacter sp. 2_MG-2023]|tara:strand:- start:11964 stop:12368 length:405 start_codon:yes stop_codon:yes gene_type:complete
MTPFGRYLELKRKSRHLKQKQLANLLGINPSYISLMETGKKPPPAIHIREKISLVLNFNRDEKRQLKFYAEQSARVFHLPDDISLEVYLLANQFHKCISELSAGQAAAIQSILKINDVTEKKSQTSELVMEDIM